LQKDLESCKQSLALTEREKIESAVALEKQRREARAAAAQESQRSFARQQEILKTVEEAKKDDTGKLLQVRLDNLLEKQKKLLDASRQVEADLLRQKENVKNLLEQARTTADKGETE